MDSQQFETYFKTYYGSLCRCAFSYLQSDEAAKDVVMDLFGRLWKKRDEVDMRNPKDYLFSSVRRRCLNQLREPQNRDKYAEYISMIPPSAPKTPETIAELLELKETVGEVIAQLSPRAQEIFQMRYIEGLPRLEIAEKAGISVKGVDHQIRRIKDVFAEKFPGWTEGIFILGFLYAWVSLV